MAFSVNLSSIPVVEEDLKGELKARPVATVALTAITKPRGSQRRIEGHGDVARWLGACEGGGSQRRIEGLSNHFQ